MLLQTASVAVQGGGACLPTFAKTVDAETNTLFYRHTQVVPATLACYKTACGTVHAFDQRLPVVWGRSRSNACSGSNTVSVAWV